jgi:hypothetical protein
MGFYQRQVLPHLLHFAIRQNYLAPFRKRVIGAAEGWVLEIGIGSGLNFPLYGTAVTSVTGLEPSSEAATHGASACLSRGGPDYTLRRLSQGDPARCWEL